MRDIRDYLLGYLTNKDYSTLVNIWGGTELCTLFSLNDELRITVKSKYKNTKLNVNQKAVLKKACKIIEELIPLDDLFLFSDFSSKAKRKYDVWRDAISSPYKSIEETVGPFYIEDNVSSQKELKMKARLNRKLAVANLLRGCFYESAIEPVVIVMREIPDDYFLHLYLSIIYAQKGEQEKAISEFLTAITFDKNYTINQLFRLYATIKKPIPLLKILGYVVQEKKYSEDIYLSIMVILEGWSQYGECLLISEKRKKYFDGKKTKTDIDNHINFYKGVLSLKRRDYEKAKEYLNKAKNYLQKKSGLYEKYDFYEFAITRLIGLSEQFEKLISTRTLKEFFNKADSFAEYWHEEIMRVSLDRKLFNKWTDFSARYSFNWLEFLVIDLESCLMFKKSDRLKGCSRQKLDVGAIEEKKVIDAFENIMHFVKGHKNRQEVARDEKRILEELNLIKKQKISLFDVMFSMEKGFSESIANDKASHDGTQRHISNEIKKAIKEPVESKDYTVSYRITIKKEGAKKGTLFIYFMTQRYDFPLTPIQFQLMRALAKKMKADKKLHPNKQGWMNFADIKKNVEEWEDTTSDDQVRMQVRRIRKKVGKDSRDNKTFKINFIETERNLGYRISTHPENISI